MRWYRRQFGSTVVDIPLAISSLGGALFIAFVVETAYFSGRNPESLFTWGMGVNVLMAAPFFGTLLYGGHWLKRSEVSDRRYRRVGLWVLAGGITFLALNAAGVAVWTPDRLWYISGWLRNTLGMGAAFGLLIGVSEARAIEEALAAERSHIRAEQLESRHEWLDYLNALLRHEVLNNTQVITGYSSILLDEHDLDDPIATRLQTIRRQSEDMARITEDVRVLIQATREGRELRAIDLCDVLDDELTDLDESYDAVEIDATLPETVYARADELVRRVFSNLLTNAVEHNEHATPHIAVSLNVTSDTVTVRIADNGPGLPPSVQESIGSFSDRHAAEHGLGLQLVGRLLDRYGGDLEVVETGADGSVVTVALDRAAPASRGPDGSSVVDPALAGTPEQPTGQPEPNPGSRGSPTE